MRGIPLPPGARIRVLAAPRSGARHPSRGGASRSSHAVTACHPAPSRTATRLSWLRRTTKKRSMDVPDKADFGARLVGPDRFEGGLRVGDVVGGHEWPLVTGRRRLGEVRTDCGGMDASCDRRCLRYDSAAGSSRYVRRGRRVRELVGGATRRRRGSRRMRSARGSLFSTSSGRSTRRRSRRRPGTSWRRLEPSSGIRTSAARSTQARVGKRGSSLIPGWCSRAVPALTLACPRSFNHVLDTGAR